MRYLIVKSVKAKINEAKKQITPEALSVIDAKVDEYLTKLIALHNGGHKRIDGIVAALVKI